MEVEGAVEAPPTAEELGAIEDVNPRFGVSGKIAVINGSKSKVDSGAFHDGDFIGADTGFIDDRILT